MAMMSIGGGASSSQGAKAPCDKCRRMVKDGQHLQKRCSGAGTWKSGTYGGQVNTTTGHRASKEHADHILEAQLIHAFFGDCNTSYPLHNAIFCHLNTVSNLEARGAKANKDKGKYVRKLLSVRRGYLATGYGEIKWAKDGLTIDHYNALDVQIRAAEEMTQYIPYDDQIVRMISDLENLKWALAGRFNGYSGYSG
ncbi:hypothetical protein FOA52_002248 [Chlamydomonas sp. UWO 241]|nr:hypothetical protein FOA52_002248 [Chlamydomonas sp. UWO 241]